MSFSEVFSEVRQVRRIPMTEFGITTSAIHAYEKGKRLPKPAHLEKLLQCVGTVALKQGANNIEEEQVRLKSAWYEDHFVKLGISQELAPAVAKLLILNDDVQAEVIQIIDSACSDRQQ